LPVAKKRRGEHVHYVAGWDHGMVKKENMEQNVCEILKYRTVSTNVIIVSTFIPVRSPSPCILVAR
jgi:hypothetical protein